MIKLLIIAFSFLDPQVAVQHDSIGMETINGKVFVIHKVEDKETLYAISKRYRTTVDAILQYNPTASSGLEIGQILKVPYVPNKPVVKTQGGSGGIIHVVGEKETLFSIAKAYSVSVDEIKQWNSLSGSTLSLGQELVIKKRGTATVNTQTTVNNNYNEVKSKKGAHTVAAKETMYSIARQYGITVQQLKEWNNLQSNELSIGKVLFVVQPEQSGMTITKQTTTTTPTVTETRPVENQQVTPEVKNEVKIPDPQPKETIKPKESTITISEAVRGSDEILESGLAELIEGTDGNRKYLALHRTAPIGTILKVKNEMNNREVFVRVMGKLPDTSMTDKLVIKVSKSAYDRLGAIDQRFRVQITYYK